MIEPNWGTSFIEAVFGDTKQRAPYKAIVKFYGDRTTKRSKVPLINHIEEGLLVLDALCASKATKDAFCLHPMFQHDDDLMANYHRIKEFDPQVMALVMEYRARANESLSNRVSWSRGDFAKWNGGPPTPGPLPEVRDMLIADKVQNYADFITYHLDSHPRGPELGFYFRTWLGALGVTPAQYEELVRIMKEKDE